MDYFQVNTASFMSLLTVLVDNVPMCFFAQGLIPAQPVQALQMTPALETVQNFGVDDEEEEENTMETDNRVRALSLKMFVWTSQTLV